MFTYRPNLPLLQAYIYENLRYKTVLPILVPHRAIRDTKLAGYKVKDVKVAKNMSHMINLFCILMSSKAT